MQLMDSPNQIHFLGHSGFIIEYKKCVLVIDPWLNKNGAFWGGWQQMPNNHALFRKYQEKINSCHSEGKRAIVLLSHQHEDHYDRTFIRELRNCEIWTPRFRDQAFMQDVSRIADSSVLVKTLEDSEAEECIKGMEAEFIVDDQGIEQDSAIVVGWKDCCFLDMNDCKAFEKVARRCEKKNIEIMAAQYTSASAHPVTFSYDGSKMRALATRKLQEKFELLGDFANKTGARRVVLCGGPVVYTALQKLPEAQERREALYNSDIVDYLTKKTSEHVQEYIIPRPDQDISQKKVSSMSFIEVRELFYRQNNAVAKNTYWPPCKTSPQQVRREFIQRIEERLCVLRELGRTSRCILRYVCTDEEAFEIVTVSLSANRILGREEFKAEKDGVSLITYKASLRTFELLSDGKSRWQDVHLTFSFEIERVPDTYNEDAHLFLLSDPSLLRQAYMRKSERSSRERIERRFKGKKCVHDRFCPHNGADLMDARIEGGQLVCPRHGWLFDLERGGRCDRTKATINSDLSETKT